MDRTVNAELAAATILQSKFSLQKHRELGLELRDPVVIPNAVDPAIFHRPDSREPLEGRRVRLVATSWSDNPRKGGDALGWLDRNLDPMRFELTFAGRAPTPFERIHVVGPLGSEALAALLRTQDAYLAPSRDDPCSNALLEALACGLPAAYRDSGGIPSSSARAACPSGGRRARRRARPSRRRARPASGVDLDPPDRMGGGPLPRGPRPERRP